MKFINTLLLSSSLILFASCAHTNKHACCQNPDHACQQGECKEDKSCCHDKCKSCDGKSSCSSGSCDLKKKA